ncbi:MAG: DUF1015 domain-containing protein [Deltaproteobacteria bacterium]|nr:MAG: DUF1015 domain-containing protein [Deltaproteobacteria bacterium]
MADVRPFRALRPRDDLAVEVIAPPYDVLSEAEARAIAENRRSFVRITRSEVDLPAGTDAHSDAAYAKARENLDGFVANGTIVEDAVPTYYFYGQVMGDHRQVGVLAACSVAEYDAGRIAKHEYTRPDKEDDRTHHMEVLDAQVGLVFLAYRASQTLASLTARGTAGEPAWRVTTEDGVEHALWPAPADLVEPLRAAFAELDTLYIADGHHRSAAASRVHANRGNERSAYFLAGLFPDDALYVMAYNRVVHDLNGHDVAAFRALLSEKFDVARTEAPVPTERGTFTMYLEGAWHLCTPKAGVVDADDPVKCLDVAVLQDHVLEPILGIDDPRRSTRISFVGGIRGHVALSTAVDEGAAVAFHMVPTGLDQLFRVADAGQVMPPKSTWFEPKLREGVVVRKL